MEIGNNKGTTNPKEPRQCRKAFHIDPAGTTIRDSATMKSVRKQLDHGERQWYHYDCLFYRFIVPRLRHE